MTGCGSGHHKAATGCTFQCNSLPSLPQMTPVISSVAESKVTHTTFKVKVVIILGRVHDAQTQQESGPEATACCSPRRMLDKGERCLDETKQTRKRQSPRHQRGCNQRWPDVTGPAVTEKTLVSREISARGRSLLGGVQAGGAGWPAEAAEDKTHPYKSAVALWGIFLSVSTSTFKRYVHFCGS